MLVLELDPESLVKEISLESLPPCFEKWCLKFDDLWENKGKKTGFRCYLAGLLGESKRKNIVQITDNILGSSYHNVHHFIGKSKWNADGVRSLPLDIALYQHADSLPEGKKDKDFVKKPDLALKLIKKTIKRKFYPGIVLMDGGYGNNSNFLRRCSKTGYFG